LAEKGLIVRHLILPGQIAGSRDSLQWLVNEISREVTVSIMSQYYPAHNASHCSTLSRKIEYSEYSEVVDIVNELGIENGWIQEMGASESYLPDFERKGASESYLPDFERKEHPFLSVITDT